ncbi:hypothetical protein FGO68_gene5738 [Halteria grandinella]|uniref:Uncharacterized protein n=1 Tax=Halteria grandinella TaxID=5974 RepID=A0A8J8SWQ8_HALGN|nr:hypothetical protein FGO68_gene5738 [Halteria grandinella]
MSHFLEAFYSQEQILLCRQLQNLYIVYLLEINTIHKNVGPFPFPQVYIYCKSCLWPKLSLQARQIVGVITIA